MEEVDIKEYLNNIREKNKDNSVKYDKLIANIPYITNKKDLKKLKEILDELKNENKDFYDYIIHFLKTTNDLEEIFLLYKEYKDLDYYKHNINIKNKTLTSTTNINYKKIDTDKLIEIEPGNKQLIENGKITIDKIEDLYKSNDCICKRS